jgi:hypothetical protein
MRAMPAGFGPDGSHATRDTAKSMSAMDLSNSDLHFDLGHAVARPPPSFYLTVYGSYVLCQSRSWNWIADSDSSSSACHKYLPVMGHQIGSDIHAQGETAPRRPLPFDLCGTNLFGRLFLNERE